ncbi:integration host factor subunit alpha [Devosia nitrariae]|uniref:Integration host factor subunit alpha n=1 Tax=Devosia nitrariae TaxID=2071872 RepID=A0ABQ5W0H6_9HYPH|nr:integration host factor subunit alpha [Devosia nitrariae]GLQ53374.1 integration host factor subunit alpha [Devosia nitrariae]
MGQALTRASLRRRLIARTGASPADADRLVTRMLDLMGTALSNGESVKLTGFGTLEVRARGARKGRNPKTGKPYPVEARKVVVFTPSARLKQQLEALIGERPTSS